MTDPLLDDTLTDAQTAAIIDSAYLACDFTQLNSPFLKGQYIRLKGHSEFGNLVNRWVETTTTF